MGVRCERDRFGRLQAIYPCDAWLERGWLERPAVNGP